MALSIYKTFVAGEVLTAADMNALQSHFTSNALSLISPLTGNLDFNGNQAILDADGDSYLVCGADDILTLRLQGFDAFIWDGDVSSPVNGITWTSAATGSSPSVAPHGETNVDLTATTKGTGDLILATAGSGDVRLEPASGSVLAGATVDLNGNILAIDADGDSTLRETADDVVALRLQALDAFIFDGNASTPVNGLTLTSSATGVAPSIGSQGSDTNIDLELTPKGSGELTVGGVQVLKTTYGANSSDQTITSGTEADITGLTGLTLPTTTSVDSKTFEVTFSVKIINGSTASNIARITVYNGADGDKGDTEIYRRNRFLADATFSDAEISGMFRFTPGAGTRTKIGLSAQATANTITVQGSSNQISSVKVVEVI